MNFNAIILTLEMQLSLFWRIMRTLAKNSKKVREKLFCPLVSALIQICLLHFAFYQYLVITDYYYPSVLNDKIKTKIKAKVQECGPEYWITWLVLDANNVKNKFFFQDVIGCNPTKEKANRCAFSVKDAHLNNFYNEEHYVDKKSLTLLSKMSTGEGMFCDGDDIEQCFKDAETIRQVINSANKEINAVSLAITKDVRNNILFVFSITNTNKDLTRCNRDKMTRIVEELSIYAQEVF